MSNVRWDVLLVLMCGLLQPALGTPNNETKAERTRLPTFSEVIFADKLKEDLDFLFKTIEEVHRNMYAYIAEAEFAAHRDKLYKQIDHPLSRIEFYKLVAPVVASLKSGHTEISFPGWGAYMATGGRFYPLEIYWHGPDVILADYYGEEQLPLGGTITAINGEAASSVFARLARHYPAEGKSSDPWELEHQYVLERALFCEYGTRDLNLDIRTLDGRLERHVVKAITSQRLRAILHKIKNSGARERDRDIFNYRNIFAAYRHIAESDAALIRLEAFSLRYLKELTEFLAKVFKDIDDRNTPNLIIDVRRNGGGARFGIDVLFRYLTPKPVAQQEGESKHWPTLAKMLAPWPSRFEGRTFVLVGPKTGSGAMLFAAAAKYYEVGTLVGEETTEPMVIYAESRFFTLPNSRLTLAVPTDHSVAIGGQADGKGVAPDHEVKQKPEDTAKGVDTVLQFTLDLIREGQDRRR
jgi:hypothetical protein